MDFRLRPVRYEELPGWPEDDPSPLFPAMADCRRHVIHVKPYRTGSLGVTADDLLPAFAAADENPPADAAAARVFFETWFTPFLIEPAEVPSGFVTAYYEPDVEVRAEADAEYRHPFYRRPDDLIDLDETNRPPTLDASYAFGRLDGETVAEYADRRAIDEGHLAGRGLEIAFARSRVDVFFAHIQGAARLRFADGRVLRITYAAKSGHPFSPIGRLLIDRGEIDAATVSMASIRAWLAAHPDRADDVLWHNRSYIFFREAPVTDLSRGPVAAAKVPLVAGRSLAVDRLIHTFGTPFHIASDSLTHIDRGRPFRRLMLALDTGTAITGPARGDLFIGSGEAAGVLAGNVRNAAHFHILIPRAAAKRFGHGKG
ncbi:murein transglycosylase A [Rhizobium sp. TRM95111]|uniref:murein transglycosylase A n=1 Tax=Rhizobium alarense TaxID=2846851 RepID=UPI001F33A8EA|nr:murein transglycosylase A [Rhizobium alarense]MCF3639959.1 murein transglycosylase A [Rhizobium alarense]